jgi:hypothetical protein
MQRRISSTALFVPAVPQGERQPNEDGHEFLIEHSQLFGNVVRNFSRTQQFIAGDGQKELRRGAVLFEKDRLARHAPSP